MLAEFLGLEKRAVKGPDFTAADYQRAVLSDPNFGFATTAEKALSTAAVWQVIELLSGDLAKLPLQKMKTDVEGREVQDKAHPTWDVVHERPARNLDAFKWWRRFWVQSLLWTNGYARINRDGLGSVESLTLLESAMVTHQGDEDGETGFWYLGREATFEFLRADQVLHVEDMALHKTNVAGISRTKPIQAIEQARNHFTLNLMVERYGSLFFEHGGRLGGWLELPVGMTQKARDKYEEQFRDVYESRHALFKTVVARGGVKFHGDQANPEQTQMIEARQEQVRDTARWWNVPPHKLGDDSRTSFNSLEQENKSYLGSTLSPRLTALTGECKCKLLRPAERASGRHFYRHNVAALMETDQATATTNSVAQFTNALITKNEGRKMIGKQPVDDGDEFMTPLNMVMGSKDGEKDENKAIDPEELRKRFDSYAIGVRAGAITPQKSDEESFRLLAGLPVLDENVATQWVDDGGVRRPTTLVQPGDPLKEPAEDNGDNGAEEDENEPETDELRHVRIPLIDSLQRALKSMDATAGRRAKNLTPTKFADWLDHQLEESTRKPARVILDASVSAYAGAAKTTENELFDRLFAALCAEIRNKSQKNVRISPQAAVLLIERIENA